MPKLFHIALSVANIAESVKDYNQRLGVKACVVVENEYALWRTETLNFSIRQAAGEVSLRHLGWQLDKTDEVQESVDVNGLLWERFTAEQQDDEIQAAWPEYTKSNG